MRSSDDREYALRLALGLLRDFQHVGLAARLEEVERFADPATLSPLRRPALDFTTDDVELLAVALFGAEHMLEVFGSATRHEGDVEGQDNALLRAAWDAAPEDVRVDCSIRAKLLAWCLETLRRAACSPATANPVQ